MSIKGIYLCWLKVFCKKGRGNNESTKDSGKSQSRKISYRLTERKKDAGNREIKKNSGKTSFVQIVEKGCKCTKIKTILGLETAKIDLLKSPLWGIIEVNLTGI